MLGPPKSRRFDAPIVVSLEELVLSFVRAWTRELYADRSWPVSTADNEAAVS
ncbi:MAG TPA: hypothetical protein VKA25_14145 [Gemmatimonadales bacterium]|nr:hypothetical protein [Gemmatimonadales bacterium]